MIICRGSLHTCTNDSLVTPACTYVCSPRPPVRPPAMCRPSVLPLYSIAHINLVSFYYTIYYHLLQYRTIPTSLQLYSRSLKLLCCEHWAEPSSTLCTHALCTCVTTRNRLFSITWAIKRPSTEKAGVSNDMHLLVCSRQYIHMTFTRKKGDLTVANVALGKRLTEWNTT